MTSDLLTAAKRLRDYLSHEIGLDIPDEIWVPFDLAVDAAEKPSNPGCCDIPARTGKIIAADSDTREITIQCSSPIGGVKMGAYARLETVSNDLKMRPLTTDEKRDADEFFQEQLSKPSVPCPHCHRPDCDGATNPNQCDTFIVRSDTTGSDGQEEDEHAD